MSDQLLTSPLNKIPEGLLDFFGIKSMGQYPQRLGDSVAPTMDLLRWYADQRATEVRWNFSNFVADFNAANVQIQSTSPVNLSDLVTAGALQVPQGEVWLILEADIFWSFTTAGTCDANYNSGELNTVGPQPWSMPLQGFTTGVAGVTRSGGRVLDHPFWVNSGHTIRAAVHGITFAAGVVSMTGRLRLVRMFK